MEIDSGNFKKIQTLSLDEQIDLLAQLGFDLLEQCDSYFGKIIDANLWISPEPDNILQFFDSELDDPEGRFELYKKDRYLSEEERSAYKDYLINRAEEDEYHPGIFLGEISCEGTTFVVVSERRGGAFDCEAELAGIFPDQTTAISELVGPSGHII